MLWFILWVLGTLLVLVTTCIPPYDGFTLIGVVFVCMGLWGIWDSSSALYDGSEYMEDRPYDKKDIFKHTRSDLYKYDNEED